MPTILITGAARGIGFHMAKQAKANNWDVIASVRTTEDQLSLAEQLPGIAIVQFDVRDHVAIDNAARVMFRPIDVLINNAGVIGPSRQSTMEMDFDGFSETLAINTLAPLKIAQAFLEHLKGSAGARLINISSQMGSMHFSDSDRIAYRASKAALNKVTQALATDLAPDKICVVAMHPGWVQTDMGGQNADIAPQMSAMGILRVVEGLTMEDTGKFLDWDGSEREW